MHLFIATPMYGGSCTGQYTSSFAQLLMMCVQKNVSFTYKFVFNEALITRARNHLVNEFMKSEATHLLFVDSDIGFKADDVFKMIEVNKDVICGIYPLKQLNIEKSFDEIRNGASNEEAKQKIIDFVVNIKNDSVLDNGLLEVYDAGTGFMLIQKNVFEKLKPIVPEYIGNGQIDFGDKISEYFSTGIDEETKVLLSEDFMFCKLWRKFGGQIFVAPWVDLEHIGTYSFSKFIN